MGMGFQHWPRTQTSFCLHLWITEEWSVEQRQDLLKQNYFSGNHSSYSTTSTKESSLPSAGSYTVKRTCNVQGAWGSYLQGKTKTNLAKTKKKKKPKQQQIKDRNLSNQALPIVKHRQHRGCLPLLLHWAKKGKLLLWWVEWLPTIQHDLFWKKM